MVSVCLKSLLRALHTHIHPERKEEEAEAEAFPRLIFCSLLPSFSVCVCLSYLRSLDAASSYGGLSTSQCHHRANPEGIFLSLFLHTHMYISLVFLLFL